MRTLPAICLSTLAVSCLLTPVRAQESASLQARVAARHELELAIIDLRNYWQIEYPRQRRELNAAIELTEMELQNNQEMLREFRPFTQFSIGQPFPITVRSLQMCIRENELRLDNLRAERNAFIRFRSDEFRALEMKVQEARLRVAELEANDTIAAEPAAK